MISFGEIKNRYFDCNYFSILRSYDYNTESFFITQVPGLVVRADDSDGDVLGSISPWG